VLFKSSAETESELLAALTSGGFFSRLGETAEFA